MELVTERILKRKVKRTAKMSYIVMRAKSLDTNFYFAIPLDFCILVG